MQWFPTRFWMAGAQDKLCFAFSSVGNVNFVINAVGADNEPFVAFKLLLSLANLPCPFNILQGFYKIKRRSAMDQALPQ